MYHWHGSFCFFVITYVFLSSYDLFDFWFLLFIWFVQLRIQLLFHLNWLFFKFACISCSAAACRDPSCSAWYYLVRRTGSVAAVCMGLAALWLMHTHMWELSSLTRGPTMSPALQGWFWTDWPPGSPHISTIISFLDFYLSLLKHIFACIC